MREFGDLLNTAVMRVDMMRTGDLREEAPPLAYIAFPFSAYRDMDPALFEEIDAAYDQRGTYEDRIGYALPAPVADQFRAHVVGIEVEQLTAEEFRENFGRE